jgi:hypothetical protein
MAEPSEAFRWVKEEHIFLGKARRCSRWKSKLSRRQEHYTLQ